MYLITQKWYFPKAHALNNDASNSKILSVCRHVHTLHPIFIKSTFGCTL